MYLNKISEIFVSINKFILDFFFVLILSIYCKEKVIREIIYYSESV